MHVEFEVELLKKRVSYLEEQIETIGKLLTRKYPNEIRYADEEKYEEMKEKKSNGRK